MKTLFQEIDKVVEANDHTAEVETTIDGLDCAILYHDHNDSIQIVFRCEWLDDNLKFLKTANFNSFGCHVNDQLETYTDHWDYANESVYQEYEVQDFDEFMEHEGNETLLAFVRGELRTHGKKYVQRPLIERIKRKLIILTWTLKNKLKTN